jgi:hypothetical protein
MTSVLYVLSGLENTSGKDEMRNIGFMINDLRNEMSERITVCKKN